MLRKFLWNLPISPKFVSENPTKFEFLVHNLSEALNLDTRLMSQVTHQAGFCGMNEWDAILT